MAVAGPEVPTDGMGRVEQAVSADLESLEHLSPTHRALAASALTLARALDEGAGLSTAAVARELRATLESLSAREESGDLDPLDAWLADLPAQMGDSSH